MSPAGQLAEWPDRLVSGLIDFVVPFIIFQIINTVLGVGFGTFDIGGLFLSWAIWLLPLAWTLYQGHLAGSTGQSMGMKQSGLRLVGEQTGQLIGSQQGLIRNLLFIPGYLCCGLLVVIDSLFPLWDPKKQTLRDKIAKSVVVKA
ncbi:MAG: RDD family protein [Acidimicrobiales bacterium]